MAGRWDRKSGIFAASARRFRAGAGRSGLFRRAGPTRVAGRRHSGRPFGRPALGPTPETDWAGVVAINSFARFCLDPQGHGCVEPAALRAMRGSLKRDPQGCADAFRHSLGIAPAARAAQKERLMEGTRAASGFRCDALRGRDVMARAGRAGRQSRAARGHPRSRAHFRRRAGAARPRRSRPALERARFLRQPHSGPCAAMRLSPIQEKIVAAFNAAAKTYDFATPVQREVARALVERAAAVSRAPASILDLERCGGHVAELALSQWPAAEFDGARRRARDAGPAARQIPEGHDDRRRRRSP